MLFVFCWCGGSFILDLLFTLLLETCFVVVLLTTLVVLVVELPRFMVLLLLATVVLDFDFTVSLLFSPPGFDLPPVVLEVVLVPPEPELGLRTLVVLALFSGEVWLDPGLSFNLDLSGNDFPGDFELEGWIGFWLGFVIVLEVGLLTDFLSPEEGDILEVLLRVDWTFSVIFFFNSLLFSRVGEGIFVSSIKGMSPPDCDMFSSGAAAIPGNSWILVEVECCGMVGYDMRESMRAGREYFLLSSHPLPPCLESEERCEVRLPLSLFLLSSSLWLLLICAGPAATAGNSWELPSDQKYAVTVPQSQSVSSTKTEVLEIEI